MQKTHQCGKLNYSPEETLRRFGHLLTAFEYGTPPHEASHRASIAW